MLKSAYYVLNLVLYVAYWLLYIIAARIINFTINCEINGYSKNK